LLLSPLAFKSFDFSGYDLIISSATGAYFPNSLNKKSAKLICYCHTPPRYLYGLPTARNFTQNKIIAAIVFFINHWLRLFDFKYAQNVNQFIANSATTAARIQKFYRKDSVIIHPPIDIPKISPLSKGETAQPRGIESFFLTGGRLARAKRYDIAIKACNQLKVPLKVFGRDFAGFQSELKQISGSTIEFLGEISQSEKAKLFSEAQAYLFCSDNEDFGMVSVEAQSYGCPVVGYKSGGIIETVVEGQTGILFDELTPTSCAKAIKNVGALLAKAQVRQDCFANAQNFSSKIFIKKIKGIVLKSS
jgi:glycosyltransferase involved in cell wall biosynthesis